NLFSSVLNNLRKPEIADLHKTVAGDAAILLLLLHDEDVCRFQVAVKYAFVVRRFYSCCGLSQKIQRALNAQCAFTTKKLMKGFALHVLHNKIEDAFRAFAEIKYGDDVRMVDRCSSASLALEPGYGLAFGYAVVGEQIRAN